MRRQRTEEGMLGEATGDAMIGRQPRRGQHDHERDEPSTRPCGKSDSSEGIIGRSVDRKETQWRRLPGRLSLPFDESLSILEMAAVTWLCFVGILAPTLGVFVAHGWPIFSADRYSYIPSMLFVPWCSYFGDLISWRMELQRNTTETKQQQRQKQQRQKQQQKQQRQKQQQKQQQQRQQREQRQAPIEESENERSTRARLQRSRKSRYFDPIWLLTVSCVSLLLVLAAQTAISTSKKWTASESLWTHAVERGPSDVIAFYNLACVHERQSRSVSSTLMPSSASLGNAFGSFRSSDDVAIELFEEALKQDPEYGAAWNNLGFLKEKQYLRLSRIDDDPRRSVADRLAEVAPRNGGDAWSTAREFLLDEAEACYRKAVRLNPRRHYTALNNLGKLLHAQRGDAQRALGRNSEVRRGRNIEVVAMEAERRDEKHFFFPHSGGHGQVADCLEPA